jgi:vancomycin permeability regulator SanA
VNSFVRSALAVTGVLAIGFFVIVFVQVTRAGNAALEMSATGDAIVVLGAAQYNGEPSPVLEQRLRRALDLWSAGAAPTIVTTGANQPGDVFTEGFAGYRYLRNEGVAEDQIVVVVDGGDTYESLLAAANQLRETSGEVIIVTDAYHSLRSKEIATEVGLNAAIVAAGDEMSVERRVQETIAVMAGRVISFRRVSAVR